jgi:hypothetical protein
MGSFTCLSAFRVFSAVVSRCPWAFAALLPSFCNDCTVVTVGGRCRSTAAAAIPHREKISSENRVFNSIEISSISCRRFSSSRKIGISPANRGEFTSFGVSGIPLACGGVVEHSGMKAQNLPTSPVGDSCALHMEGIDAVLNLLEGTLFDLGQGTCP